MFTDPAENNQELLDILSTSEAEEYGQKFWEKIKDINYYGKTFEEIKKEENLFSEMVSTTFLENESLDIQIGKKVHELTVGPNVEQNQQNILLQVAELKPATMVLFKGWLIYDYYRRMIDIQFRQTLSKDTEIEGMYFPDISKPIEVVLEEYCRLIERTRKLKKIDRN